mgnify:CR=1 FL=1
MKQMMIFWKQIDTMKAFSPADMDGNLLYVVQPTGFEDPNYMLHACYLRRLRAQNKLATNTYNIHTHDHQSSILNTNTAILYHQMWLPTICC